MQRTVGEGVGLVAGRGDEGAVGGWGLGGQGFLSGRA